MRSILLSTITLFTIQATAQYGTFDASAVKEGKGTTTIVVLDEDHEEAGRADSISDMEEILSDEDMI